MRHMKIQIGVTVIVALSCLVSTGYAASPYQNTPAGITDTSRDETTFADFIRLVWVDHGTPVTYIGRNDAAVKNVRAFFTATTFVKPAVTVDQLIALVGNYFHAGQDIVLMRCRPTPEQRQLLSPILATWPNVFSAIVSDFQAQGYSCPPDPNDGNNVMYCGAKSYQDFQQSVFVSGLLAAFTSANQIFQNSGSSPGADALKKNYGIYPAFTGLGFAAAGSGTAGTMSATQVLRESIVPEYLLKNISLADAGCRCIQVPQYGNAKSSDIRHSKPVDPKYVWQRGRLDNGECHQIARLRRSEAADQASSDAATSNDISTGETPVNSSPFDQ